MTLALRFASLLFVGALAACSLVIDKNETQCVTDSDCEQFGNHPTCSAGVCVDSGLGPPGCFFGTPSAQDDFANQCTTSTTLQYDNCAKAGLCDQAALDSAIAATATPTQSVATSTVNNETMPTTNCADLGNVIYITGSTNLPPLLKAVQPLLYKDTIPYIAVFAPQTSCKGAASVYDLSASKHLIQNVTNNWAFYYDQNNVQQFCLLDSAGNTVDVGETDVFPTSCDMTYHDMPNVAEYTGPIQAITFVVPAGSSQKAISAEAAHLVFGTGSTSPKVDPWTDSTLYFTRSSGTGTTQLPSRAINLDPTKWWGIDRLSAPNLVASMEAIDPNDAEKSIGILSNDLADKNRANLTTLYFQQKGQQYGYLPDSSSEAFDKKNVRDGHYPVWGPVHFVASTVNGVPSQAASSLITKFSVPKLDQELVAGIIEAGFVPACAMKVKRDTEVGPLSSFTPNFGCSCFFDMQVGSPNPACQTCTGASDCSGDTPACNYGFCEKQ